MRNQGWFLLSCLIFCRTQLYESARGEGTAKACYCCDGEECDTVERSRFLPMLIETFPPRSRELQEEKEKDDRPTLEYE